MEEEQDCGANAGCGMEDNNVDEETTLDAPKQWNYGDGSTPLYSEAMRDNFVFMQHYNSIQEGGEVSAQMLRDVLGTTEEEFQSSLISAVTMLHDLGILYPKPTAELIQAAKANRWDNRQIAVMLQAIVLAGSGEVLKDRINEVQKLITENLASRAVRRKMEDREQAPSDFSNFNPPKHL